MKKTKKNMAKSNKMTIFVVVVLIILINLIGFLFNSVGIFFSNVYNDSKEIVSNVANGIQDEIDNINNTVEQIENAKKDPANTIIDVIQNNVDKIDIPFSTPEYKSDYKFDRTKLNDTKLYQVISVSDGDTIKIDNNGKEVTIRMIGVDTPETVDPRKPVQCFGKEASNFTKSLLTNAKVYLVSDPTQQNIDRYGRWLRYVVLEDMTFFNYELINQGYAHEYTYGGIAYIYQMEFKAAEKNARENKRGLWAPETCNGDTKQEVKQ